MLWLTWQMWILLMLAFAGGVITGWSMRARSDDVPERADDNPTAEAAVPAPAKPAPVLAPVEASEPDIITPMPVDSGLESVGELDQAEASSAPPSEQAFGLTDIKGLGPKAAEKLQAAGIAHVEQIAAWSSADVEKFDELINGRGRIERDDWVGQAKALMKP